MAALGGDGEEQRVGTAGSEMTKLLIMECSYTINQINDPDIKAYLKTHVHWIREADQSGAVTSMKSGTSKASRQAKEESIKRGAHSDKPELQTLSDSDKTLIDTHLSEFLTFLKALKALQDSEQNTRDNLVFKLVDLSKIAKLPPVFVSGGYGQFILKSGEIAAILKGCSDETLEKIKPAAKQPDNAFHRNAAKILAQRKTQTVSTQSPESSVSSIGQRTPSISSSGSDSVSEVEVKIDVGSQLINDFLEGYCELEFDSKFIRDFAQKLASEFPERPQSSQNTERMLLKIRETFFSHFGDLRKSNIHFPKYELESVRELVKKLDPDALNSLCEAIKQAPPLSKSAKYSEVWERTAVAEQKKHGNVEALKDLPDLKNEAVQQYLKGYFDIVANAYATDHRQQTAILTFKEQSLAVMAGLDALIKQDPLPQNIEVQLVSKLLELQKLATENLPVPLQKALKEPLKDLFKSLKPETLEALAKSEKESSFKLLAAGELTRRQTPAERIAALAATAPKMPEGFVKPFTPKGASAKGAYTMHRPEPAAKPRSDLNRPEPATESGKFAGLLQLLKDKQEEKKGKTGADAVKVLLPDEPKRSSWNPFSKKG